MLEARLSYVIKVYLFYMVETAKSLDVTLDDPVGLRR